MEMAVRPHVPHEREPPKAGRSPAANLQEITAMSTFPAGLTGTWDLDPTHTTIGFAVRHAMVSTVRGHFGGFAGGATIDTENPERSTAWLDIDPRTITTNNEQRDGHLRSGDFFEIEKYPVVTFRSTSVELDGDAFVLTGDLTIRGVTNPVSIVWEFGGLAKDPWGNTKAGFEGTATVNRRDWGLTYNAALETGGVLIADKVKLVLDVEAVKRVETGTGTGTEMGTETGTTV
jgi:polyisoprenoid-binding protein YceI